MRLKNEAITFTFNMPDISTLWFLFCLKIIHDKLYYACNITFKIAIDKILYICNIVLGMNTTYYLCGSCPTWRETVLTQPPVDICLYFYDRKGGKKVSCVCFSFELFDTLPISEQFG